tara:strand:+ start:239 stop:1273 length:1035 start_codon:yes stop_codon:yes gene_type:complete
MKYFISTGLLLTINFLTLGQEYSFINSGTDGENHHPFYGLYDYSHNMYIFDKANLGDEAKEIFELTFELASYGQDYIYHDLTVKMAHTSDSEFKSNVRVDLSNIDYTQLTTCVSNYDLEIDSDGYVTISFSTPFNYNGSSNLLVIIENHDGDWTMGFGAAKGEYTSDYKSWYKYTDYNYPTGTGTRQRYTPNIGLGYFTFNPLPIELLSFTGYSTGNNDVELQWSTASEQNNSHFTIWRSYDGQTWNAIHEKMGAGNSNAYLEYNFSDLEIKNDDGLHTIYYKLSQTDYDGNSEVFDPIAIELKTPARSLLKTVNLQGETVENDAKGFVIEVWSDGHNIKKIRQ